MVKLLKTSNKFDGIFKATHIRQFHNYVTVVGFLFTNPDHISSVSSDSSPRMYTQVLFLNDESLEFVGLHCIFPPWQQ